MIDNNPFKHEVNEISAKGNNAVANYIKLTINTPTFSVSAVNIVGMNRYRDYIEDFTQKLVITINTSLGDYENLVHSDLSSIKATMIMYDIPAAAPFSMVSLSNPREFTYKAKLLNIDSNQLTQNTQMANNTNSGNLTLKEFSLQLLEPCFESVSIKTVSGNWRNTNGIELIKTLLTRYSTEDENDSITAVTGVDIVPGYNTAVRESISFKPMTPLTQAVKAVNENCGGVYPTGFSFFLQSNLWYVFPPYDLTLFSKGSRTITVVNLPKNRLPSIEKTFYNVSSKLIVLSTRDARYIDKREENTYSKGNSVRFVEANRLYEGVGISANNKYNINASKNINELSLGERSDGANILRASDTMITSNKFNELSKLAKNNGFYFQLTWENSDDSLLFPGMPAKILFLKNNQPASVEGTLIETETIWTPMEKSFKNVKLQRMTAMTFFVGNEQYLSS